MRTIKVLYYISFFSFFCLTWWKIIPSEQLWWMLLGLIAAIVLLQVIAHRKYGKVVTLNSKTDSIILVTGMVLLAAIKFTVVD
jgi:hypothetical protein